MYLVSRSETFAKLFFLLSFSGLLMYSVLAFYTFHTAYVNLSRPSERIRVIDDENWKKIDEIPTNNQIKPINITTVHRIEKKVSDNMKHIIIWTNKIKNETTLGQLPFLKNNCSYVNCYITANKSILKHMTDFDAVMFTLKSVNIEDWELWLPLERSPKQKYIFYSMVPSDTVPVCHAKADDFFNWTWSYKRYSDIATPFIEVKDIFGKLVGPRIDDSKEIAISNETSKSVEMGEGDLRIYKDNTVRKKTKALVIYFTRCDIPTSVRSYVSKLKKVLNYNNHTFDIYGCDIGLKCPKGGCIEAIKRDYFFYLVYQNHNSEDYITDEVLKAYDNDVVPIVVGGADFSRFLPHGSYINAAHESLELLSAMISYTITTPGTYQKFFTWKKHFRIQRANINNGFCKLCQMLNDKKIMEEHASYKHFRKWWYYGDVANRCLPKEYTESKQQLQSMLKNDQRKKLPRVLRAPRKTKDVEYSEIYNDDLFSLF